MNGDPRTDKEKRETAQRTHTYKRWTPSEIETLRTMFNDGAAWHAIAEAVGHSECACIHKASKLWPDARKERNYPRARIMKTGKWTDKEVSILHYQHQKGVPYQEIGRMLGRTAAACAMKAQALGLTRGGSQLYARSPSSESRINSQLRRCLNCKKKFRSEGPHNRMCQACRRLNVSPFEI